MPPNRIPERNPVGDVFTGAILKVDSHTLLIAPPLPQDVTHQGEFIVRYGFVYLGKHHLAVVAGILALDYGDMLTGEDAFSFILNKSNLHPRADVVGYRNDGEDEMIALKWLDLALPPKVLIYENDTATRPLAEISALIAPEDAEIATRITDYLTRFETIKAWREAQHDE